MEQVLPGQAGQCPSLTRSLTEKEKSAPSMSQVPFTKPVRSSFPSLPNVGEPVSSSCGPQGDVGGFVVLDSQMGKRSSREKPPGSALACLSLLGGAVGRRFRGAASCSGGCLRCRGWAPEKPAPSGASASLQAF